MRARQAVLAIAAVNLRRLVHDRVALFFTFVLPMLIIVLLGAAIPSGGVAVGVVDEDRSAPAEAFVAALDGAPGVEVRRYDDVDALQRAVRREAVDGGVVVPTGYAATQPSTGTATVELLAERGTGVGAIVRTAVEAVVAAESARVQAARLVVAEAGGSWAAATAQASVARRATEVPSLTRRTAGAAGFRSVSTAEYAAIGELVLFVFLIALTGAGDLVDTRALGVSRRTLAAPVRARSVVVGEGLGRFMVAAVQATVIIGATALLYGIAWGSPAGVVAVVGALALVATAASLLVSTLVRSSEQATSLGPVVGISLGMLGGCMWPLEIVPAGLAAMGRLTPQAWAVDGLVALMGEGAGLRQVLPDVGVLAAMAAVLVPLAAWRLRRRLIP